MERVFVCFLGVFFNRNEAELIPEGVGLESVAWTKHLGVLGLGWAGSVVEGVVNEGLAWMLGPSLLMLFASAFVTVTLSLSRERQQLVARRTPLRGPR